ncbi:MAG: hydrogenase, partial [Acidobacteria bacterium]|nr:hydrogenase [Acidobacteriota bacterium]
MADDLIPIEDPNRAIVAAGTPDVMAPGHTFGSVTDKISAIVLTRRTPLGWYLGFGVAFLLSILLLVSLAYLT